MHRSSASAGSEQFNIKIYNYDRDFHFFFDNGTPAGSMSGKAAYGEIFTSLTYAGHRFKLKEPLPGGGYSEVRRVITMDPNEKTMVLGSVNPGEPRYDAYIDEVRKLAWLTEYKAKNGKDWIGFYGRGPPSLPYMDEGLQIGERRSVTTAFGDWFGAGCQASAETCAALAPKNISLHFISVAPRVLVVKDLLSQAEAEAVIALARPRLTLGSVGQGAQAYQSTTRTSELTFLSYSSGFMLNLQSRFADVVGVSAEKLRTRAEPLQVVQYLKNQRYQPHYDASTTGADTRFLTLLAVLQPASQGGCTSFPRAFARRGLEVCLAAGDAVLFYSLLPDGNMDEDSVHSGDRVTEGTKWAANIWVHDDPGQDEKDLQTVHENDL